MNLANRTLERIFTALASLAIIWFAVEQIFDRLDRRLPAFVAAVATYVIAAYILLPRFIRFTVMISRRGRIPRFTRASDGLLADPVNIVLVGSEKDLKYAFKLAGWHEAEKLSIKSACKMVKAFILNHPYPKAPFSALYLFGRRQDHGFQESIGQSPRQRHHVRFWAANIDPEANYTDIRYWMRKHTINQNEPIMWVGAATKDIGIGLTKLSYKVTHRVDCDIDEERRYLYSALQAAGVITNQRTYESGEFVVGKYVSDGHILVITLASAFHHSMSAYSPAK